MMNRHPKHEENREKFNGSRSNSMKKKKNMRRMGGQGLSLEAFANAKSNSSYFNPALIKKQKEFYKNSKYVNKYKKSLKQQQSNPPLAIRRFKEEIETKDGKKEREAEYVSKKENENETECGSEMENGTGDDSREENETGGGSKMSKNNKKKNKYGARSILKVYEMKHEDEEKARMEREAIIQAKKEEREKAEARRKSAREKMLKKTRKGQPVMKYRIQHLLETIQGSSKQT
ncbi:rRNA-processing protein FYV7-like [Pyrus ussuriensis x Pyrus communis]|uniref:rRNA-processing protein FYV7-like n=1 Tax=Pyrus ussuriensis x Pyrus communis TaxID=2448454 RepID=A0A5N5GZJ2_9ROSA|nr:rRNA-processing protein FYV7-like [Pyrus x bretschneideri]KAB2616194.1 rRNA-processing protein FYV7-like [Pyrus ussuriensis x Pyrus communis]